MINDDLNELRMKHIRLRSKTSSFLGFLAAGLSSLFGKSRDKPTVKELRRADFRTSTQQLGIRFNEKIRDVFRFKWLKKRKPMP